MLVFVISSSWGLCNLQYQFISFAVSFMIFSIQSENLATFVKTPGRPTGHPFIPHEVIPIRVALPSTSLIKPPEIVKITYFLLRRKNPWLQLEVYTKRVVDQITEID